MLIKELVDKYMKQGHNYRNAQNLAEEAKDPASKWIDVDYDSLRNVIIEFIQTF